MKKITIILLFLLSAICSFAQPDLGFVGDRYTITGQGTLKSPAQVDTTLLVTRFHLQDTAAAIRADLGGIGGVNYWTNVASTIYNNTGTRVGVNRTTSIFPAFDVQAETGLTDIVWFRRASGGRQFRFQESSGAALLDMYNVSDVVTLRLTANGTSYINGGTLALGTTTATERLEANGTIAASTGFRIGLTGATIIGNLLNDGGALYFRGEGTRSVKFGSVTNGVNVFFDNFNNRTGFGTITPDADLHLNGDFKIENTGSTATIFHNDSTSFQAQDASPLIIKDDGGLIYAQFDPFNGDFSSYTNRIHNGSTWKNALRKTAANSSLQLGSTTAGDWSAIYLTHKIGIENNDPQEQLSINDNTSGAVYAHFTNTTTGTTTNDGAKIGLSASEVLTINQIENAPIDIGTNNTIQVTIEADGDVIIYNDIIVDNSNNVRIVTGSGSPESAVTAGIGSTYHRTDGGAGTSFYVKESGTGNTGWIAK